MDFISLTRKCVNFPNLEIGSNSVQSLSSVKVYVERKLFDDVRRPIFYVLLDDLKRMGL